MNDVDAMDGEALRRQFTRRALSPVEVTKNLLARIDASESAINAFVFIDREGALVAAHASEQRYAKGAAIGPADGIAATVKDNLSLKGFPKRNGSLATSDAPEAFDAPAVARLREAGVVILGKTTMPEFGWKGLSDSPLTGLTRNPWRLDRTTGGSSSGAAACAALGLGHIHLGTDGAGSLRIPAAFTGVVGFKTTHGRVPAYPISVMGELAHVGAITRSTSDQALALSLITAPDRRDFLAWTDKALDRRGRLEGGITGLKIGFSPRLGHVSKIDPEIETSVAAAARVFEELGAHVEEADPRMSDPRDILNDLWFAGAALALRAFKDSDRAVMDPGFLAAALRGQGVSGATVLERLLVARGQLIQAFHDYHDRYDLLLTPQMSTVALPFGNNMPPPGFAGVAAWGDEWTEWSPFTYPFNITQAPAISLPCGLNSEGLPIGLQLVGRLREDETVLIAARAFEKASPFARIDSPRPA